MADGYTQDLANPCLKATISYIRSLEQLPDDEDVVDELYLALKEGWRIIQNTWQNATIYSIDPASKRRTRLHPHTESAMCLMFCDEALMWNKMFLIEYPDSPPEIIGPFF